MPFQMFGGCDLHIPHKEWSGNPQERDNYAAIEQWAQRLKDPECGGSSCGCTVQESDVFDTIPDDDLTSLQRSDGFIQTLCGDGDIAGHLQVVFVAVQWTANGTTGTRQGYILGNGETQTLWGQTVPACAGPDGNMKMTLSRLLPAQSVNNYAVVLWQNSGAPIDVIVHFTEYYPCCECDWAFPC